MADINLRNPSPNTISLSDAVVSLLLLRLWRRRPSIRFALNSLLWR